MKGTLIRVSCTILSITLLLSLAACAKQSSSQEPEPDSSSPADQSAAVSEAAPEEGGTEYQTYEIPMFGLQFDCPADFGDDVESRVISDDEVSFSVVGGDWTVYFHCSRIASLKDSEALAALAGVDSTVLYEDYQSLDVAAAIAARKESGEFDPFELLDSFSTPDSYGFYYVGKEVLFGSENDPQMYYQYKNYGSFGALNDLIRVDLQIIVPESVGQEAFTAFCEALTSSLRLSDSEAPAGDGAPSGPEGGKSGLKALSGGTSDAQCEEIVNMFFEYASLIRYGAPSSDLMLLMDGNKDLFKALEEPGEILCSSHSFTSDLTFQLVEKSGTSDSEYSVKVIETRGYDEEELGTHEYMFTFWISINSPTDYCITGIDNEYMWAIDTSYHGPDYEESSGSEVTGSFVSIYDDEDGIYDGPPDSEFFGPGDIMMGLDPDVYQLAELEAQRTYGANAQIIDGIFDTALLEIKKGDCNWAVNNHSGMKAVVVASYYEVALDWLENWGLTNTPLYELALYRYNSAVLVWGID